MTKQSKIHEPQLFSCLLTGVLAFALCANAAFAISPDPLALLKTQVHSDLAAAPDPTPTGFSTDDYLETIDGIVQYFRGYQQSNGAIFDPYTGDEVQYSTPYYALCASVLYTQNYRSDQPGAVIADATFLESAALALDWAAYELYNSSAADGHSNFYTLPSMIAYWNLKDHVAPSRVADWDTWLAGMPSSQYGKCCKNWKLTASTGDYLRWVEFGVNTTFLETYIAENMPQWTLEGLYRDGTYPYSPMAYDGFGRLNFQVLDLYGYTDTTFPGAADIHEYNGRGAWTSMLMQSPWGEMPLGGRSAQHQWNETEMCFIYEAWAAQAKADGDTVSARAFKRAARLSYSSLRRWVQPAGYVHIVKNNMDPVQRFGYERYSYLSQYNMWTAGFLSLAVMQADDGITEGPAPADIGGFAFEVPDVHKAFANCDGLYLQLDTDPETGKSSTTDDYDITGLMRIHKAGVEPLVGPSAPTTNLGVLEGTPELGTGIAWDNGSGGWQSLADVDNDQVTSTVFNVNSMSGSQVDFSVTYNFSGVPGASSVTENYVVTPTQATVNASVTGSATQTKMRYAAFLYDGRDAYTVGYGNGIAQTKMGDSLMTMELTSHPSTPFVRDENWVNSRNGYMEPIEGIVDATSLTYVLRPQLDPTGTLFTAPNQYTKTEFGSPYAGIPAWPIVSSSASSEQTGNPAVNSYDGYAATRWGSENVSNQWIEYDLGSQQLIDQIFLDLYKGDSRTYSLKIEIDGVEVWSGSTTTSSSGWTLAITPTTGKVVRLTATGPNSDGSNWFSIYETMIGSTAASDTTPPADPTNLIAVANAGAIDLSWNANSEGDLDHYNVKRSTGSGYAVIGSTTAGTTSYTDSTAMPGQTYYYAVTAVDTSSNESGNSNEQTAPLYPGDLTLDNQVDLLDVAELGSGWQTDYAFSNLIDIANDWLEGIN